MIRSERINVEPLADRIATALGSDVPEAWSRIVGLALAGVIFTLSYLFIELLGVATR